ncbi:MAG: deoxynucleoside kinase [Chromatiaceae bacterium]|nr:deoxynucleoside kinase [Chromatiaceae bacterium]MCP5314441.1 deoxynucleoside kinase [Chromatiaceae bacterium]
MVPKMPEQRQSPPEFIVVEGPIGVGKTSLVRRLTETLGYASLFECAEDNPFLARFYDDPLAAAFPAQLHFLFQRSRQLEQLRQRDLFNSHLVADFMFAKDRLFAELNLQPEELALYDEVYARLEMQAPRPDLILYLQAPVDELMQRVRRRNRTMENSLAPDYLARLSEAYARYFYYYDASPVLIVDTAELNLVDSESDYQELLCAITRRFTGKSYFNPTPLAIN